MQDMPSFVLHSRAEPELTGGYDGGDDRKADVARRTLHDKRVAVKALGWCLQTLTTTAALRDCL